MTTADDQVVSFCVPTGNFGNICAGHVARMMGLPIETLVLATNENNVLDEFFRTGIYRVRSSAETHATSSPSMDISKASNFERFVFDLLGRDAARVRELFAVQLPRDGYFDLSDTPEFAGLPERFGFVSAASTHADRLAHIADVYRRDGIMVDPHTADGIKVARDFVRPGVPMIVTETALPVKFSGHHRRGDRDRARPSRRLRRPRGPPPPRDRPPQRRRSPEGPDRRPHLTVPSERVWRETGTVPFPFTGFTHAAPGRNWGRFLVPFTRTRTARASNCPQARPVHWRLVIHSSVDRPSPMTAATCLGSLSHPIDEGTAVPRHARQLAESGIYHVMLRGVNRDAIFLEDEDCDALPPIAG